MSGADNQQESLSSEDRRGWFLAGLVEGEGSACVSLKEHPTTASGYYVQPCFFIYQHSVRRALLEMAKEYFGCGSIYPKPGNPDVLVYAINSRRDILHAVVPFLQRYRGVLGTPHRLRCVHPDRSAPVRASSLGAWRDVKDRQARLLDELEWEATQAPTRRSPRQNPQRPYARRPWPWAMRWSDLRGDTES